MRILTVDTANGCGSVASMAKQDELWPGRMVRAANGRAYWQEHLVEVAKANWAASLSRVEPCELEYPECGYELDVSSAGVFTMRTAERVCLGVYLEGRLAEVQGPVKS